MLETQLSDGLLVLRLNAPPVNTLTYELLESLREAVREAADEPGAQAVVIVGDGRHFSAGADIGLFQQVRTADDAIRISQFFQAVFQELEDSPKPVVAAVAGTVVGGALELAMACHFRVAARGARFRMPEVTLGINPGAGGTQRLPRLVGLDAALRMLLTGETVEAQEALTWGLIDAVGDAAALIASARQVLAGGQSSPGLRATSRRTDKISDLAALAAAWVRAEQALSQVRPELVAPGKILETVRVGLEQSVAAGMRREQTAFAECVESLGTRNKIQLFFATSRTSKVPELQGVEPLPVNRVAVVGMGMMGTGIVHALAQSGVPVVVVDERESALQQGVARIRSSLQKRVAQHKLAPEHAAQQLDAITTTTRWDDLAEADLIIEAVFEDVDVKRAVLSRVESICSPTAIIATNTSTISLDDLAADLRYPARLLGLHFFNPAQRMPLVEMIRRRDTQPAALAAALQLAKRLRKTPVVVANREGFLVNRLFVPYLQEAFWLLEEGAAAGEIDAAAVQFGFPMGPLALIDMAGLDILVHAHRVLQRVFPRHGPLSSVATQLVEQGHWGQKTGMGVYRYEPGAVTPHDSPATSELVAQAQRLRGRAPRAFRRTELAERLVLRMVAEAGYVLDEGLVQSASDLDVAMVLGMGFPDFRGGVWKYASDLGLVQVAERLDELSRICGERFSPHERWRKSQ